MRAIEWFEPKSIEEAVACLVERRGQASLIAGGTDLVGKMNDGEISPQCLIDLSHIEEMKGIRGQGGWVRIGAATTFAEILRSPIIARMPALVQAAGKIGGRQIQNLGTLGGNICSAEPCADAATACISLHAQVVLQGRATRQLALEQVFSAPGKTVLRSDEILTEILIPQWPAPVGGAYEKLSLRIHMDQSQVAVGVSLSVAEGDVCREIGIGMATVAPVPKRALQAERALRGQRLTGDRIAQAACLAEEEASPRDSYKASANYRRQVIPVLVERAVSKALALAH